MRDRGRQSGTGLPVPGRRLLQVLYFNELIHFDGYAEWVSGFAKTLEEGVSRKADAPFNSLPVYESAYRLAVEATQMAARPERNYRY